MVVFFPRWSTIVAITFCLLASGCTTLRENAPDGLAALIDRALPPTEVAGLDYPAIAELGIHGACDELAEMARQNRTVPRRQLEGSLLPACDAEVRRALAEQREAARLDGLIEAAWQELLVRRELQRLLDERRQLEMDLQRRQMLRQQAIAERLRQQQQQQVTKESRLKALVAALAAAAVHQVLADLEVEDKAMAYSVGQVSERSPE
jgi:hypothetical protein